MAFAECRPARLPPVPRGLWLTGRQDSHRATDRSLAAPAGALTLGFDAGRFPPTPPACYPAPWCLPGPDFHRQADASLCSDQVISTRPPPNAGHTDTVHAKEQRWKARLRPETSLLGLMRPRRRRAAKGPTSTTRPHRDLLWGRGLVCASRDPTRRGKNGVSSAPSRERGFAGPLAGLGAHDYLKRTPIPQVRRSRISQRPSVTRPRHGWSGRAALAEALDRPLIGQGLVCSDVGSGSASP